MILEGFKGMYPALVSPRDAAGEFSPTAFEQLIGHIYDRGSHGVYVAGNTGEGYLMTVAERKLAAEVSVKMSKGQGCVVVHVGAPSEREAVELAKHAAEVGADGISSLPPYVQGYKFDDILAYYEALGSASNLPVFVYYIPVVTHQEYSLDQINQMLAIEGVVGIKFTNFNLFLLERMINGEHKPHVFNGHDEVALSGIAAGAQGGIGTFYNLMPSHFVEIYEAVNKCDLDTARSLQGEVNELIRICQKYGGHASVRAVLKWQGIDCGDPVKPTRPLDEEGLKTLRAELEAAGLNLFNGQ
jgi:N-acetylneuraminate lyase